MPYTKTISFLSKKTIATLFILFCCVGNISPKDFQDDSDLPAIKIWQRESQVETDRSSFDHNKHLSFKKPSENHWTLHQNDDMDTPLLDLKYDSDSYCWKIAFFKKTKGELSLSTPYIISKERVKTDGITIFVTDTDEQKLGYKKGASFTSKLPIKPLSSENILKDFPSSIELTTSETSKEKTVLLHVQYDENGETWIESNKDLSSNSADTSFQLKAHKKHLFHKRKIVLGGIGVLHEDGSFKLNQKGTQFSAEDLKKGITFIQKNGALTWHSDITPFEKLEDPKEEWIFRTKSIPINLSVLSNSNQEKTCFHIQKDDNDAIWIRSNQSLKSKKNENTLLYLHHEKQFFGKQKIIIDELGTLQEDGSFKLDPKISATQFSAEDIKKGMTFTLKNGKFTWHPEIIPFEELEDPTEEVMNNFYNPEQPAQLMDYASAAENTPEPEISFFSSLSNNKATVACTATGLAIAAVLAHVLSGRNYLAKTDTWSNWSPSGLNSVGLRALPQKLLLEKLYQEIAYCYGNSPDPIEKFLEDIEQEIHQLNLCYWSYSILHGLYLLPKIQKFEDITQRIYLLEMFADTIQRELANKTILSLV